MFLYNLVVHLYALLIRISAFRNLKAKQWVQGRKNWESDLKTKLKALSGAPIVWVHCASYGEFEQGRPVMEAIRQSHPNYRIVLSFFSPSGYEAFKHWPGADVICYLPLDTRSNARFFLQLLNPKAAIFIKYEFWLHFLFELKRREIPSFLVSAVFKPHHPFFKWYGALFRKSLRSFHQLFIQDVASGKLLDSIGITNYTVSGDTRFDRVVEIRNHFKQLPFFDAYCAGAKVIVAGSTWPKDEEMLVESFLALRDPQLKLIFAPHEVNTKSIGQLEELLHKHQLPYVLYSDQNPDVTKPVLIVNAMGLLNKIYHYASIAYVGGGFNAGIHNCLEPAVYQKPLLFFGGNNYTKYNEAVDLLKLGAAVNIVRPKETSEIIRRLLTDEHRRKQIADHLNDYFKQNAGTTEKVMAAINW